MISFAPHGSYQPQNSRELLSSLNSRLDFHVPESDFTCTRGDDMSLVAWVCVDGGRERRAVEKTLRESRDLRLLSVGYFCPQDRNLFELGPGTIRE
jgi:hypothetical protein